ncbi:unnamed protein product [Pseudo-nitzschia multistriata]|uniref:Uncharacterized protein n=1 Tax=Pseudo-nitzschia multistriata TaxID=183589 RepID=A0A448YYW4_9STRA|nr:unnamed protein product [Pseudo-nitzschia multistriata]
MTRQFGSQQTGGKRRSAPRKPPSLALAATVLVLSAPLGLPGAESFCAPNPPSAVPRRTEPVLFLADGDVSRRTALASLSLLTGTAVLAAGPPPASAAYSSEDVGEIRAVLIEARKQLETVPALLADEKFDGVRTLLTEAPLRDCWSKTTPILKKYAEALGDTDGDELAALEGREELLQHLRFLDMAVYNNVFNPIATEGKTGASKALIDSYYNDPTREYETSKRALDELLILSK